MVSAHFDISTSPGHALRSGQDYEGIHRMPITDNRVETTACPTCNRQRTADWFIPSDEFGRCWKCRELNVAWAREHGSNA